MNNNEKDFNINYGEGTSLATAPSRMIRTSKLPYVIQASPETFTEDTEQSSFKKVGTAILAASGLIIPAVVAYKMIPSESSGDSFVNALTISVLASTVELLIVAVREVRGQNNG